MEQYSNQTRLYYDPNSISNFNRYRIVHTTFDWNIDFDRHILHGHVQLDILPLNENLCERSSTLIQNNDNDLPHHLDNKLILDARQLHIENILYKSNEMQLSLPFEINTENDSLTIDFQQILQDPTLISILINYSTSSDQCKALQWLAKEQTADRQHPYLFSQCQAILARSLYPCQDTPGVKSTYTAKVTCPKPLTVLMNAIQTNHDLDTNTFYFEQTIAIPSYLIAIAVGYLVSYDLSDVIRVWTEPSLLDQCKYEFAETKQVLLAAEHLLGKYKWKRYDFIILPPSLPYGGMENPCMNFISPTILAGDRSLVSIIVHELIHSWIGNLVTNENWEHFWLNEGITSFIETKLLGKLAKDESGEVRRFYAAQQWEEMETDINDWGLTNPYTCLVYRLKNIDPDDAYSSVQYFKGAALLWYLEQDIVRSERDFDEFLRSYVEKFSYRILNTDDFIHYFQSYFPHMMKIDWNSWLYTPGMPPIVIDFSTKLERQCRELAENYSSITSEQLNVLTANQIAYLLNLLLNQSSTKITYDQIKQMDSNCHMNRYSNCEISYRWYQLCIRVQYIESLEDIFKFLGSTSRMKYLKVMYSEFKFSWSEMMSKVKAFFQEHKQYMHPIAIKQIEIRL